MFDMRDLHFQDYDGVPRLNGISIPGLLVNTALRVQPHPPLVTSNGTRLNGNPPYGMITMTHYQANSNANPGRHRVLGTLNNIPHSASNTNQGHLYSITSLAANNNNRNTRYLSVGNYGQSSNGFYGKSKPSLGKGYAIPDGQVNLANHNIMARNVGGSLMNHGSSNIPTKFAYRQKHDGTVEWRLDSNGVTVQDRRRIFSAGARKRDNSGN